MEDQAANKLLKRCAFNREPEVSDEFLAKYGQRLVSGVRRALRRSGQRPSPEDREDLLQEVYCHLLEQQGRRLRGCRGREERVIGAYLAKVAESVTFDRLRARAAAKRGRGHVVSVLSEWRCDRLLALAAPGPTPEERILRRERRRLFLGRCRSVMGSRAPRRDLRIICLALLEGWTSREIAHRLGGEVTPSTIDSVIHRLRRRLARAGIRIPRRK